MIDYNIDEQKKNQGIAIKKDWTQSIKGKLSQGFCTQQNMTSNYTLMVICQKTKLEKNW